MCDTPRALDAALQTANQADVIDLAGINPINCPTLEMTSSWTGGSLFFSDSPEYPTTRGVLYRDSSVSGTVGPNYHRVFLYHVAAASGQKLKFSVLIKNLATSSATLTVQKSGSAGPTTSYLYAGKLGFYRWLLSSAGTEQVVTANSWARLDSYFDTTQVASGSLLHGIWDYSMTQPHEILIVALNPSDDPITVGPTLSILSRDTHQRGTFPFCDKVYDTASGVVFDTVSGIMSYPIGGGTSPDDAAVGTDMTDGIQMTLAGNYGVNHKMHLAITSSDGRNVGVLINPRGGQWGGAVWAEAGVFPSAKLLIPASAGSTGLNTNGALEGEYDPGTTPSVWAQFMPTGGSSFPVRWVLVPYVA